MSKSDNAETLDAINVKLSKLTSWKHQFGIGVARGFGTAVGATVVAAIGFSIFSTVVDSVDETPVLREIINETNVEEQ